MASEISTEFEKSFKMSPNFSGVKSSKRMSKLKQQVSENKKLLSKKESAAEIFTVMPTEVDANLETYIE